ncbi:unnamed protein product [Alopecurus aequalis]
MTRPPRRILDDTRREGVATVLITCRCNPSLICHCKPPRSDEEITPGAQPVDDPSGGRRMPTRSRTTRAATTRVPIENLPEELLPTILSKLDSKQAARTSVLSSAWEHAWKLSPKLTLDIVAICGAGYRSYHAPLNRQRYVQRFIDSVDAILRQRRGNVIEQLELRFDVADLRRVSRRLGDWVRFAVSSRAKSLTLDVSVTSLRMYRSDWYALPLQLLDAGGGVSILQHLHLSCVSLKLPSPSFPKLKRLGLCYASVSAADLGHMLSNCPNLEWLDMSNLEWLDMYKVHLDDDDELRVNTPLSRLLYLRLSNCRVTKIELNASKLKTFIFQGDPLPAISLGETPALCDVNIHCYMMTLEDALGSLLDAFRMAQRLSLCCTCILPEFPWRVENTSRLSRLRHLQLILNIRRKHADDVLSIAYFLEAAPLLEELDIVLALSCKNGAGEPLRSFPQGQFKYKCLKSLRVCEFRGQKSQSFWYISWKTLLLCRF